MLPSARTSDGWPGAVGSNVTARPSPSTAVHCVLAGQERADTAVVSICSGRVVRGDTGSKVTARPSPSTAVHWVGVGHATARSVWPGSIWPRTWCRGERGVKVVSSPALPTTVHLVTDG